MTWFSIIVSGIVTYFSRMAMVALIDREMLGTKVKEVLNYVPAAVFPAIIFPGVFFNDFGSFVEITDPKIYGAIVALIVGFYSRNVIATIVYGFYLIGLLFIGLNNINFYNKIIIIIFISLKQFFYNFIFFYFIN